MFYLLIFNDLILINILYLNLNFTIMYKIDLIFIYENLFDLSYLLLNVRMFQNVWNNGFNFCLLL